MKVLFLATEYPTRAEPVTGIFVREHARAAALRAEVRAVHLHRAPGRRGLVDLEWTPEAEPPLLRVPYRRFGRPLSYAAFLAGARAGLRALRRQGFDPDVLHASSHLSALAALSLRKPVVYSEHWSAFLPDNPSDLSPPMRRIARLALERARLVLPVSEAMRRALERLAPRARFRIVPNVVDDGLFRPGAGGDGSRLLTAGLLGENGAKGVDYLLEALALVDGPRLDVVGDGPRRDEYEALARRLGLDGRVVFHGYRLKAELAELMRKADLFVLASRFENNPCVAIEAMASGLPLVATRVGGLPELVDERNGVLAAPRDPESIAAGIREALGRTFDRAEIARRARERFGRERVAALLASAYEEALAPGGRPISHTR